MFNKKKVKELESQLLAAQKEIEYLKGQVRFANNSRDIVVSMHNGSLLNREIDNELAFMHIDTELTDIRSQLAKNNNDNV